MLEIYRRPFALSTPALDAHTRLVYVQGMAIEAYSRKTLAAVEADLASGTTPIDVEIKLQKRFGCSPQQAERYVQIARARTVEEREGKDARLFYAAGIRFKRFLGA